MTAEQHLQTMIGALHFEIAQLRAENEQLRAAHVVPPTEEVDPDGT